MIVIGAGIEAVIGYVVEVEVVVVVVVAVVWGKARQAPHWSSMQADGVLL